MLRLSERAATGMKKVTAALLLLLLLLLSACGKVNTEAFDIANQKTQEYVELMAKHDTDGTYAMLYPGGIDRDSYETICAQSEEYCPITPDYALEMQQYDIYSKLGDKEDKRDIVSVMYQLRFDGKTYYISVVYQITEEEQGFTSFHIMNEQDFAAANKQSAKK